MSKTGTCSAGCYHSSNCRAEWEVSLCQVPDPGRHVAHGMLSQCASRIGSETFSRHGRVASRQSASTTPLRVQHDGRQSTSTHHSPHQECGHLGLARRRRIGRSAVRPAQRRPVAGRAAAATAGGAHAQRDRPEEGRRARSVRMHRAPRSPPRSRARTPRPASIDLYERPSICSDIGTYSRQRSRAERHSEALIELLKQPLETQSHAQHSDAIRTIDDGL